MPTNSTKKIINANFHLKSLRMYCGKPSKLMSTKVFFVSVQNSEWMKCFNVYKKP